MRKRPVLLLACSFVSGLLYGGYQWPVCIAVAVVLLVYAAPWKESGLRRILFAAGIPLLFLLGMLHMERELAFRAGYMQQLCDGQTVKLAGKLNKIEKKKNCFYYYLTDCTIRSSKKNMPCNDVIAYSSSDEASIGQILVIKGTISLFGPAANEGGFDAQTYYRSQKIDFGIWIDEICSVHGKNQNYAGMLYRFQQRLQAVFASCVEDDGVLSAMLLGEKGGLDTEVKSLYQKAGIAHILAISGLHVSLLGMGLYRLLKSKLNLSYAVSAAGTALFMFSYLVMTGNSVSTKRAVGMLFLYLLADMLGRSYDMLSALGTVCILLLWENPFLIGYSGFLFSVAAVLGIGAGGGILTEWREVCLQKNKKGKMQGLWISFAIQLFTLPLVAYHYYEIPVYAMLINLFVLWLLPYLLGLAAVGALAGSFLPAAGKLLLFPCGKGLGLYEFFCGLFLRFPGAQYLSGKPELWRIIVYYLLLGEILLVLNRRSRRCREQEDKSKGTMGRYIRLMTGITVSLLVLLLPGKKEQELDVLDVGQGDGIYYCTESGISLFIDGGSSDEKNVGTYRILPFLKAKGVKKISYWFISHTDEDHIAGMREVLEAGYPVEYLVFARAVKGNEKTGELLTLAEKHHTKILYLEKGDCLHIGEARLNCLYPKASEKKEDINDLSLVFSLKEKEFYGFFGGDISQEVEEELLRQGLDKKVNFYKASHHGSRNSGSSAFLEGIAPEITVASAGKGNRYGHPHPEAVQRIRESGSAFLCTADCGQIKLKWKDKKVHVYARFSP